MKKLLLCIVLVLVPMSSVNATSTERFKQWKKKLITTHLTRCVEHKCVKQVRDSLKKKGKAYHRRSSSYRSRLSSCKSVQKSVALRYWWKKKKADKILQHSKKAAGVCTSLVSKLTKSCYRRCLYRNYKGRVGKCFLACLEGRRIPANSKRKSQSRRRKRRK